MKTLGILGGMGPKATSVLYDRIVDHTDAHTDQEHINTIILSDGSIPDRTVAIVSGDTAGCRRALVNGAKKLEAMGAEVIIMPCNTAHYFIEDIQEALKPETRVLNMNRLAVNDALAVCSTGEGSADSSEDSAYSYPRIGIMATDGTLATGLYDNSVTAAGAGPVAPSEGPQEELMSLIYADIKAGLPGDQSKFESCVNDLSGRTDAVILACTELSVYKEENPLPPNYIDAMDSLVRAAIIECGAVYK